MTANIIILGVIVLYSSYVVARWWKDRKKPGSGCSGCCGNCIGCGGNSSGQKEK